MPYNTVDITNQIFKNKKHASQLSKYHNIKKFSLQIKKIR